MKKHSLASIILLIVLLYNCFIPNCLASANEPDYYLFPMYIERGIPSQAWYTKLIDLKGLNQKHVNGTLHFELVPDMSAKNEYKVKDPYGEEINVIVRPGFMNYSYDVPFGSDDFVDSEFTRLARSISSNFGKNLNSGQEFGIENKKAYKALFDHAFLHEWGTIEQNNHIWRVGKVYPSHFPVDNIDASFDFLSSYAKFKKYMGENHLWVKWQNDPEKEVTGWFNSEIFYFDQELNPNRRLINDLGPGSKHLAQIPEFLTGTFKFSEKYIKGSGLPFCLRVITRPIAISKEYDSAGNIKAIEKPLFPLIPQRIFLRKNNEKILNLISEETDPFDSSAEQCDYVLRYILKEKPSSGIDLKLQDENPIVEVVYSYGLGGYTHDTVYVYKNREAADKHRYTYKINNNDNESYLEETYANEITEQVTLHNSLNNKVFPQTGDSSNIIIYSVILIFAVFSLLLVLRKKSQL
ncbi:MAG: LPXTG cell wall anchor domain-containing protein [Eubacteriales bacterium]|nr:LPXTG cell wall anchor domain-containing protein [Eubacteriales bacterium]